MKLAYLKGVTNIRNKNRNKLSLIDWQFKVERKLSKNQICTRTKHYQIHRTGMKFDIKITLSFLYRAKIQKNYVNTIKVVRYASNDDSILDDQKSFAFAIKKKMLFDCRCSTALCRSDKARSARWRWRRWWGEHRTIVTQQHRPRDQMRWLLSGDPATTEGALPSAARRDCE